MRDTVSSGLSKNRLRVEVIDTYAGFLAVEQAWKSLEDRDPEMTVFLSWDWLAQPFRQNPFRWSVVAVYTRTGDDLIGLLDGFAAGGQLDLSVSLDLIAAIGECDVDLGGLFGGDGNGGSPTVNGVLVPSLDPVDVPDLSDLSQLSPEAQELIGCLRDAFGEEKFDELVAGTYTPTFADFGVLSQCDIDLTQLAELGSLFGQ